MALSLSHPDPLRGIVDTLSRAYDVLCGFFSEGDIARIAQAVRPRFYPKNSIIVFEDDPGDSLYVVVGGQVKIVLIAEDGREVILSIRSKGEFFGEMSLIDDEPRSAHVIAMEDANLLVLRRDDFRRCLTDVPEIAVGLLRALCTWMREADARIGGLILLDVPGRVARLLLQLADEGDGEHISKRITHHQIAQMLGSSRETVSRTMSSLANQRIIEVARRKIAILNRPALETAAGIGTVGRIKSRRALYDGEKERRRTDQLTTRPDGPTPPSPSGSDSPS